MPNRTGLTPGRRSGRVSGTHTVLDAAQLTCSVADKSATGYRSRCDEDVFPFGWAMRATNTALMARCWSFVTAMGHPECSQAGNPSTQMTVSVNWKFSADLAVAGHRRATMDHHDVTGYYTYRSLLNAPDPVDDLNDIRFAESELFLYVAPNGTISGTLAFPLIL